MSGSLWQCSYISAATRSFLAVRAAQKRMEERVAMLETAIYKLIYKLEKFISSGEPSVKLSF